jgi:hypothetical protein
MAKKQPLLFELMKEDEQPQEQKGLWDHLFRKKESGSESAHLAEVEETPSAQPSRPVDRTEPTAGQTRLYLRLNTYSLVLAVTAGLVIFFCGYILGKSVGYQQGTRQRSDIQLSQVKTTPADSEVLEIFSTPSQTALPVSPTAIQPKAPEKSQQMTDISQKEDKISRKTGSNYLIIQNFGLDAVPIAELAKKFLADKGIQSTIERSGRSYKLVSAEGFDYNDPQGKVRAESFKRQIETVGQEFKQQREAFGVSFEGCYYEKWK